MCHRPHHKCGFLSSCSDQQQRPRSLSRSTSAHPPTTKPSRPSFKIRPERELFHCAPDTPLIPDVCVYQLSTAGSNTIPQTSVAEKPNKHLLFLSVSGVRNLGKACLTIQDVKQGNSHLKTQPVQRQRISLPGARSRGWQAVEPFGETSVPLPTTGLSGGH